MLDIEFPIKEESEKMPSLNHSYICTQILRQLFSYPHIEVLTELTLDIDNGLTPDICVYSSEVINPNFSRDINKLPLMPILAIEIISSSQNIQTLLEKAERMIIAGIKVVWTVEPYTRSIFVTTKSGESIVYNNEVESEGIKVNFKAIFSKSVF
jgi:Uma2 family endonuclease